MQPLDFAKAFNARQRLQADKKAASGAPLDSCLIIGYPHITPSRLDRPIYSGKVNAGQSHFPSPAQDYEQKSLDLNERYVTNPPATFFFEVSGESMIGAGIHHGDTLIVNRAIKPRSSHIVIAEVDGEWMVKRLYKRGDVVRLLSENPSYPPITFAEGQELVIFGVATYVMHQLK